MVRKINNILFVCTGNICRSPFAEGLAKKLVDLAGLAGVAIDSAGLLALPGNAATSMAQRVAAEHGVDLTDHEAKTMSGDLLNWCDLALVMEKSHKDEIMASFHEAHGKVLLLRHFARSGSRRRGIADPYGLRYEAYRFCFLDIEEAVTGLTAYLTGNSEIFEPIRVNCYEGYKANETPRSFELDGRTFKIAKIVDRWYDGSPDGKSEVTDYFKVQTADGSVHILRYSRSQDSWTTMTN